MTTAPRFLPKDSLNWRRWLQNAEQEKFTRLVFLDFREFRRHIENIAWEPEGWIEANPIHMIHNGPDFLRYPDESPDLKKYHENVLEPTSRLPFTLPR
jgi:hypothetical protein